MRRNVVAAGAALAVGVLAVVVLAVPSRLPRNATPGDRGGSAARAPAPREEEAEQVRLADLVARGRRREDASVIYLVVEVSWGVGVDDVRRAAERAELLSRAGVQTVAVVAGSWIGPDAAEMARGSGVWQVVDGRAEAPGSASRSAG